MSAHPFLDSISVSGASLHHAGALAHVTGTATYLDDMAELPGTLHAAPVCASVAHGWLRGIDARAALGLPGVRGMVCAADLSAATQFANRAYDEPIFAHDKVLYCGHVVALIVADDVVLARDAARLVRLDIVALPALTEPEQAHAAQSYVSPPVQVQRGNAQAALARAPHTLEGSFDVGAQEHFYLEGQIAYVLPQEANHWRVYSSTQHPSLVQQEVAHALGVAQHAVAVQVQRLGGAFGGKETQSAHLAVWAALAARKFQRPVKLRLDRSDDFKITGQSHPFRFRYRVGFDAQGLLCGLDIAMLVNCGFSSDLSDSVADRAILHVDNAYFLEDVLITSYRCKTNLPSQTASRGSGAPQGMVLIERIMGDIALVLGLDPLQVRLRNVYDPEDRSVTHYQMRVADNILEPVLRRLSQTSHYQQRRADIAAWNAQSPVIQRGIALTPVKFGINFAATLSNQAGALVHVYADGSVQVSHGGVEMGQGIDTKIAQVVAQELGIPFAQVSVAQVDTSKVPNTSASAFSEIDLNGRAAQAAARHVRDNLAAFVASLDQCGLSAVQFAHGLISSPKMQRRFSDVVQAAYANRIHLWSDGFYRSPKIHYDQATHKGRPFYYFSYGAACSEVAVDTLTGESRVLRVDILHDVGRSINPALDIGQIEGGFVQGMGWLTTEQLVWDTQGRLQSAGPATYKIPTAGDVPLKFQIELWPEPNYEDSLHGSKAVGEPPMMLAISVFEALRDAVATACGTQTPVPMQVPATAQEVLRAQSVLRNLPYADQALREGDGAPLAAVGT